MSKPIHEAQGKRRPIDITRYVKFRINPGRFEAEDSHDFFCTLSCRITEAQCYLYLASRADSCVKCLQKLSRLKHKIDKGAFSDSNAPIIGFYLTAMTGWPGISEKVQQFNRKRAQEFRAAKAHTPPRYKDQAYAKATKAIEKALAPEKVIPKQPIVEVTIDEPPQKLRIIKRKKAVWVETCNGCRTKKEIAAWGFCQECLDKGK
jgi:hypothetical protein